MVDVVHLAWTGLAHLPPAHVVLQPHFASRPKVVASLALLRALDLSGGALIEDEGGAVVELVAWPALLSQPPPGGACVAWGPEAGPGWRGCRVLAAHGFAHWPSLRVWCAPLDAVRLDVEAPGWQAVVATQLRGTVVRRNDGVTVALAGARCTVAVTVECCGLEATWAAVGPATRIAHERRRFCQDPAPAAAIVGGPLWARGGCVLEDGGLAAAAVEPLLRAHCPTGLLVHVCSAHEALRSPSLASQCDALVLLHVDGFGDAAAVAPLIRLVRDFAGPLLLVTSDASALPPSLVAAVANTARIASSLPPTTRITQQQQQQQQQKESSVVWQTIVGHTDGVAVLRRVLEDRVCWPRVVWMYGGAGSGKTLLCETAAACVGSAVAVHRASIAKLIHGYIGESEKALAQLFRTARDTAPSLVLMDAADALFGKCRSAFWSQLLHELDALLLARDAVVVLLTTSAASGLGPLLVQGARVTDVVPLGAPTLADVEAMWPPGVARPRGHTLDTFGELARLARKAASEHQTGFTGVALEGNAP